MKIDFNVEYNYREKILTVEMQLIHRPMTDEIYSTAYRLDISSPVELSMFREILDAMERQTSRHAVEKLNLFKHSEHRHILHLEERIRHLEKQLLETTGIIGPRGYK